MFKSYVRVPVCRWCGGRPRSSPLATCRVALACGAASRVPVASRKGRCTSGPVTRARWTEGHGVRFDPPPATMTRGPARWAGRCSPPHTPAAQEPATGKGTGVAVLVVRRAPAPQRAAGEEPASEARLAAEASELAHQRSTAPRAWPHQRSLGGRNFLRPHRLGTRVTGAWGWPTCPPRAWAQGTCRRT